MNHQHYLQAISRLCRSAHLKDSATPRLQIARNSLRAFSMMVSYKWNASESCELSATLENQYKWTHFCNKQAWQEMSENQGWHKFHVRLLKTLSTHQLDFMILKVQNMRLFSTRLFKLYMIHRFHESVLVTRKLLYLPHIRFIERWWHTTASWIVAHHWGMVLGSQQVRVYN